MKIRIKSLVFTLLLLVSALLPSCVMLDVPMNFAIYRDLSPDLLHQTLTSAPHVMAEMTVSSQSGSKTYLIERSEELLKYVEDDVAHWYNVESGMLLTYNEDTYEWDQTPAETTFLSLFDFMLTDNKATFLLQSSHDAQLYDENGNMYATYIQGAKRTYDLPGTLKASREAYDTTYDFTIDYDAENEAESFDLTLKIVFERRYLSLPYRGEDVWSDQGAIQDPVDTPTQRFDPLSLRNSLATEERFMISATLTCAEVSLYQDFLYIKDGNWTAYSDSTSSCVNYFYMPTDHQYDVNNSNGSIEEYPYATNDSIYPDMCLSYFPSVWSMCAEDGFQENNDGTYDVSREAIRRLIDELEYERCLGNMSFDGDAYTFNMEYTLRSNSLTFQLTVIVTPDRGSFEIPDSLVTYLKAMDYPMD